MLHVSALRNMYEKSTPQEPPFSRRTKQDTFPIFIDLSLEVSLPLRIYISFPANIIASKVSSLATYIATLANEAGLISPTVAGEIGKVC